MSINREPVESPSQIFNFTPQDRWETLRIEFALQGHQYAPDRYMKAAFWALRNATDETQSENPGFERNHYIPELAAELQDVCRDRPMARPNHLANTVYRSLQGLALELDPDFPKGRHLSARWQEIMQKAVSDTYVGRFREDIRGQVTSNIPERSKLLKLTALLHEIQGPIQVHEVGTSQMLNLKQLAIHMRTPGFEYLKTIVMARQEDQSLTVDERSTKRVNGLLRKGAFNLGHSVGIDLYPYNDKNVQRRARSHSFYASEIQDGKAVRKYDALVRKRPRQVHFYQADYTNFDHEAFVHAHPESAQADIVYVPTCGYQIDEEGGPAATRQALENAFARVKENGLILWQDYVEIKTDSTMEYCERWDPYTYNLWVFDTRKPDLGFQKYISAEGGRAKKIILEPALGRLALARDYLDVPQHW